MNIAIIGAGNVGANLAKKLYKHNGIYSVGSSLDSQKVKNLVREIPEIQNIDLHKSIAASEIVIIAVHAPAIVDLISSIDLTGKIVIDAANQLFEGIKADGYSSVSDYIVKNSKAKSVYKAFNTNFAESILSVKNEESDMLYAGTDIESDRQIVESIIKQVGFSPKYVGGLEKAAALELFAKAFVTMLMGTENARQTSYKFINN